MESKFSIAFSIVFFLLRSLTFGNGVIWLSNNPPVESKKTITAYGMHKLSAIRGKRGSMTVIQWVRSGNSVEKSEYLGGDYVQDFTAYIFSPAGEPMDVKFEKLPTIITLSFNGNLEGFYNEYLVGKIVKKDTLYITVAKAELLSHLCRNGHSHVLKSLPVKIYPEQIPFEIVRERIPHEDFHTFISSGDKITYTAYLHGEVTENTRMTLFTQEGWEKTQWTDNKGQSQFQFVQDYFSPWKEFKKRNINYYLLRGQLIQEKKGVFEGQPYKYIHYSTTLSDGYYPSEFMYKSLLWALIIFLSTLILPAIGIYIYRERRKKPYQELFFYEKD